MKESFSGSRLRFGAFELDETTLELTEDGRQVSLQQQPARVLAFLAARAGQLVERVTLQHEIWGDQHVNADQGLNNAIHQIRGVLHDDPGDPRYLETLPRLGYRFLASVERSAEDREAVRGHQKIAPFRTRWGRGLAVGALVAVLALAIVASSSDLMSPPKSAAPVEPLPATAAAKEAYLEGLYRRDRGGPGAWEAARTAFARSIAADPDFAPAHLGLAEAMWRLAGEDFARRQAALAMVEAALARSSELARAHLLRAEIAIYHQWDRDLAERHYRLAASLGPEISEVHSAFGFFLAIQGKFAAAVREADTARELDPISAVVRGDVGLIYSYAGLSEVAVRECRRALELDAQATYAVECMIDGKIQLGDLDAAAVLVETRWPSASRRGLGGDGAGQEVARSLLQDFFATQLNRLSDPEAQMPPGWVGVAAARAGDVDLALDWLSRAHDVRSPSFLQAAPNPVLRDLRHDPRFVALLSDTPLAGLAAAEHVDLR